MLKIHDDEIRHLQRAADELRQNLPRTLGSDDMRNTGWSLTRQEARALLFVVDIALAESRRQAAAPEADRDGR